MKEGLSGSINNELEVNDRWYQAQIDAKNNLAKVKELERLNPKPYQRNGIGIHTPEFKEVAKKVMSSRMREKFERKIK